jgi:hypothetical protein
MHQIWRAAGGFRSGGVVMSGQDGGATRTGLRPACGTGGGSKYGHPPAVRLRAAPVNLVRRLVLSDDRRRNAAALADLVAALLRPCPNFRTALAARSTA